MRGRRHGGRRRRHFCAVALFSMLLLRVTPRIENAVFRSSRLDFAFIWGSRRTHELPSHLARTRSTPDATFILPG